MPNGKDPKCFCTQVNMVGLCDLVRLWTGSSIPEMESGDCLVKYADAVRTSNHALGDLPFSGRMILKMVKYNLQNIKTKC